jgi:hypothetical protein
MRSCSERTTLHCVESYLYYIILVNKKIILRSETREKNNRQYIYTKNAKYIPLIEILLALILVDGRGTLTSKERTFVVLQLVTNVALIEYT